MSNNVLEDVLMLFGKEIVPDLVAVNAEANGELDRIPKIVVGTPTLIYGFSSYESLLRREPRMAMFLSRPRTVYLELPCEAETLKDAFSRLAVQEYEINVAVEKSLALVELEKNIRQLKHLIDHSTPDRIEKACREAREELGLTGSTEEIVAQIKNFKRSNIMKKEFSGKVISGVFCDIQGTLMDYDAKEIQSEVLAMLHKYEAEGKTISLWSGGEFEEFQKRLAVLGVNWPVLSKYDFEGCTVEIAIDDKPAKEIEKEYGIRAEQFVLWDPYEIWS